MRVIAGSARRTELEVAGDSPTRPFLEMARGALFNSLAARIPGASVLDLYAGSGALGLEALSRGAEDAVFVERDAAAFAALGRNIAKCGFAKRGRAVRADVTAFLAGGGGSRFDIVFVDPPFPELGEWRPDGVREDAMRAAAAVLAPDGVLVFRVEDRKVAPPAWPGLELLAEKRYGRSRVCRYGVAGG